MKKAKISYIRGEKPTSLQDIHKEYIFEYLSENLAAQKITKEQLEAFLAIVQEKNTKFPNHVTAFSEYRREFCKMFKEFEHLLEKKKPKKVSDTEYFGKLLSKISTEEE